MKGNIKREGGQDRGKPRGEELWMPKRRRVILPERGNNSKMRRPEVYEIHLCSRKGDHVGYGLRQPRLGVSMKGFEAVRWSKGIARWWRRRLEMEEWEGSTVQV